MDFAVLVMKNAQDVITQLSLGRQDALLLRTAASITRVVGQLLSAPHRLVKVAHLMLTVETLGVVALKLASVESLVVNPRNLAVGTTPTLKSRSSLILRALWVPI